MSRIDYGKQYTNYMYQPTNQKITVMELKEVKTTNKKPVYFADGVRVTRDYFDTVKVKAQMFGALSCFQTKVIDLGDGRSRVIQYVTATY